jgi:hypothetical protein
MARTYRRFIVEKKLPDLAYAPGNILACDDVAGHTADYRAYLMFDAYNVPGRDSMPEEKWISVRNKHLDHFVDWLVREGIPVAERLPVEFSKHSRRMLDEMIANET